MLNAQTGRRKFLKQGFFAALGARMLLAGATGGAALFMMGCNVFEDIENWVPVGLAAFQSVVSLLASAGVINPVADAGINLLISAITNAFNQIVADVKAYQAITPAPAGALQKIQATLSIIVQNLQAFLNSINVTDSKLLDTIVGLAQIILSTIAAFENDLVAKGAQPGTMSPTRRTHLSHNARTIQIVPQARTVNQFISDFNSTAAAHGHPEVHLQNPKPGFFKRVRNVF
jgi:hypothetical protein